MQDPYCDHRNFVGINQASWERDCDGKCSNNMHSCQQTQGNTYCIQAIYICFRLWWPISNALTTQGVNINAGLQVFTTKHKVLHHDHQYNYRFIVILIIVFFSVDHHLLQCITHQNTKSIHEVGFREVFYIAS